jgi:uncharacterized protein
MRMCGNDAAMNTKNIWLNLPVKDVKKSKEFFKAIGFKSNPMHEKAENLTSFLIGEHDFVLMLFPEEAFKGFTRNKIANTKNGTEVLVNIDAQSKQEVDEMAEVFAKQEAKYLLSLANQKVGCMRLVLRILTDIDGVCFIWI